MDKPVIILIGTFDTKGDVFSYLYDYLKSSEWDMITVNTGTFSSNVDFQIDFDSDVVARLGGKTLHRLHQNQVRHQAVEVMSAGAARVCSEMVRTRQVIGAIGAGGGGGTYMTLRAMQDISFGIPKVCISTLASKDLSSQMGTKDIVLVPSIVDVAHLNTIIRPILDQSIAALRGMALDYLERKFSDQKVHKVAISMFGNTTSCVERCTEILHSEKIEVLTFHATGIGGRTMEALIGERLFDGVMDITTTELADFLCGGVCDAGPARLEAAVELGLPQVVVPGCLDMVNFTYSDRVPERYKNRNLYQWSPDVTLMRTNVEENRKLGEMMMSKLNKTQVPVYVIIPLRGLSAIDMAGSEFHDPEANLALFESIKINNKSDLIHIIELNLHINDPKFAEQLVNYYFRLVHLN